ncbi:hypothetical protein QAD02_004871 [Eretmocerus hayati]|uniref:Uncharacterized protein n=1 Tax=Eretmocerus hayati TaxID=131215 RepID=A0ACC2NTJ5_9HYME|nr:hypothetical protein QAD02_004871 [Eretmocerus hayati]
MLTGKKSSISIDTPPHELSRGLLPVTKSQSVEKAFNPIIKTHLWRVLNFILLPKNVIGAIMATSDISLDQWGLTQVKVQRTSYTWTISNFSFIRKRTSEELESPSFSIGPVDDGSKWHLKLYPSGINDNFKNHLSLYLCRKPPIPDCARYTGRYELSLIDAQGHKVINQSEDCEYNKSYTSWGFPDFTDLDFLKGNENRDQFFPNDRLTLRCDLNLVIGVVNVSSTNESVNELHISTPAFTDKFLEKLFLDEKYSDVRLATCGGESLVAHKCILAGSSPIFAAMFEHDMIESKLNVVDIDDVELDVLKEMLRFIYARKVENLDKVACGLLAAADKYEIQGLKEICARKLEEIVGVGNVVEILVLADRHNVQQLKRRAMNFVRVHVEEVVESAAFKQLVCDDVVIDIVKTVAL